MGDYRSQNVVSVHDELVGHFDDQYRSYDRDYHRSTFAYGRRKIGNLIEGLISSLNPGARALDIGCGTGFHLRQLKARGLVPIGVEPAPGMRRRAQTNNPTVQVLDGGAENLPFEDGTFDFVLCIEVIRYLPTAERALAEIRRVLRPGGTALITAANLGSLNAYWLVNQLTSRVRIASFSPLKHSFLTPQKARALMHNSDFHHVTVHGLTFGPWQLVSRAFPSIIAPLLRSFEPVDELLAKHSLFHSIANHLVLVGRAPASSTA